MHCLFEIKMALEIFDTLNSTPDNTKVKELMEKLDERTCPNLEALNLIYWVRTLIFGVIRRPYELGYWMIQRVKVLKQLTAQYFTIQDIFKISQPISDYIFDYELEKVKFYMRNREWAESVQELEDIADTILDDKMEHLQEVFGNESEIFHKIINKDLTYQIREFILESFISNSDCNSEIESTIMHFVKSP